MMFSCSDYLQFQPVVAAAPTYIHSHLYRNVCVENSALEC